MLIFVPVLIGIYSFSGHIAGAGAYSVTVMTACQLISQLSSRWLAPLLSSFLALSITSGISLRIKLRSLCDMLYRFIKWVLVFTMSLFTAVLSLQSAVSGAADTLANRAVRLTLSSLIPIVGSAVSEAYKTINGSVNVLRSGIGIFAVIAVMVTFIPVILRAALWLLSINASKCVAEVLGVEGPAELLSSVGSALSLVIALSVCVMTVFIISASVLMNIGGAS